MIVCSSFLLRTIVIGMIFLLITNRLHALNISFGCMYICSSYFGCVSNYSLWSPSLMLNGLFKPTLGEWWRRWIFVNTDSKWQHFNPPRWLLKLVRLFTFFVCYNFAFTHQDGFELCIYFLIDVDRAGNFLHDPQIQHEVIGFEFVLIRFGSTRLWHVYNHVKRVSSVPFFFKKKKRYKTTSTRNSFYCCGMLISI